MSSQAREGYSAPMTTPHFNINRRQVAIDKPSGLLITIPLDGSPETQQDTVQCRHCSRQWVLGHAILEASLGRMGFCHRCNGPVCPRCQDKCIPQEQWLDLYEKGFDFERETLPAFSAMPGRLWTPGE